MPIVIASAAAVVGAIGLVVLAFDGYVEDYGNRPAETQDLAIPLLSESALLYFIAWRTASGRSIATLAVFAGAGAVLCTAMLASGSQ